MVRLTIKNLIANRVRLALTTFAVVLGVSFVVASFVLTDGLRATFGDLIDDVTAGVDLEVRPEREFGAPQELDESLLAAVSATDGVASAAPVVEAPSDSIRPLTDDGEPIPSNGPPQLAFGWSDDEALSLVDLVEGEAPTGPDDLVMDVDSATTHGFEVGSTYEVLTPDGRGEVTLTGLVSFGDDNATAGATLMFMTVDTIQELTGTAGYQSIRVVLDPDANSPAVQAELAALASDLEVVDASTLADEQKADFNSEIGFVRNLLLGFAGVSLFVSAFIIYNTFSIMLGQRTRELALLRVVGADPVQLRRSVLAEAVGIGVLASTLGIGAGVALEAGLRAMFGAMGATFPDTSLVIAGRTIALAFAIGVGATVLAAIGPARRACRVPAIAALRDDVVAGAGSGGNPLRLVVGTVVLALGAAACGTGLFVASTVGSVMTLLAAGAAGVFLGITMVSPLVAVPLTRVLGWPLRQVTGVSGTLAQQNAGRNPHRTATTAAALMIGLALVSMALTVGQSAKAHLRSTLANSVQADYIIQTFDSPNLPDSLTGELAASPVTDTLATLRLDSARIGGEDDPTPIAGLDHAANAELFDLDVVEGVATDPAVADPVLIHQDEATARGLGVGDVVSMEFSSGTMHDLEVTGIYADATAISGPFVVDDSTWDAVGASDADVTVFLSLADGVTVAEVDQAFAPLAAEYPQVEFDTATEFVERLEGLLDEVLTIINALVALAVIIALLGIANTLALSVFERTRELGLLRAVGMTRRQLRRMVRIEATLIALFGAALGVGTGVAFGWATVEALPDWFTSTLAIPTGRIAILVAVAAAAGLVAAWGPARRAGRLDVLDAISN